MPKYTCLQPLDYADPTQKVIEAKRYEIGAEVEMPADLAEQSIALGHLEPAAKKSKGQSAAEKAEAERLAAEKAEAERLAAEKAEAERLAAEEAARQAAGGGS